MSTLPARYLSTEADLNSFAHSSEVDIFLDLTSFLSIGFTPSYITFQYPLFLEPTRSI